MTLARQKVEPIRSAKEGREDEPAHHLVPRTDDALHVEVAREESDDAVWDRSGVLDEERAKVAHDGRVVAHLESRRDLDLVRATRDDLYARRERSGLCPKRTGKDEGGKGGTHERQETVPRERHDVRLEDRGVEAQHLRVHVERRERARRDDDAREPLKDGRDGERSVEADEVEDRVGYGRVVRLERLEEEAEACGRVESQAGR